jgi:hypothetical protein
VYKALFTASWVGVDGRGQAFLWGRNNQLLKRVLQPDFVRIDMGLTTAQMSSRRTKRVAHRLRPRKAVSKIT